MAFIMAYRGAKLKAREGISMDKSRYGILLLGMINEGLKPEHHSASEVGIGIVCMDKKKLRKEKCRQ